MHPSHASDSDDRKPAPLPRFILHRLYAKFKLSQHHPSTTTTTMNNSNNDHYPSPAVSSRSTPAVRTPSFPIHDNSAHPSADATVTTTSTSTATTPHHTLRTVAHPLPLLPEDHILDNRHITFCPSPATIAATVTVTSTSCSSSDSSHTSSTASDIIMNWKTTTPSTPTRHEQQQQLMFVVDANHPAPAAPSSKKNTSQSKQQHPLLLLLPSIHDIATSNSNSSLPTVAPSTSPPSSPCPSSPGANHSYHKPCPPVVPIQRFPRHSPNGTTPPSPPPHVNTSSDTEENTPSAPWFGNFGELPVQQHHVDHDHSASSPRPNQKHPLVLPSPTTTGGAAATFQDHCLEQRPRGSHRLPRRHTHRHQHTHRPPIAGLVRHSVDKISGAAGSSWRHENRATRAPHTADSTAGIAFTSMPRPTSLSRLHARGSEKPWYGFDVSESSSDWENEVPEHHHEEFLATE